MSEKQGERGQEPTRAFAQLQQAGGPPKTTECWHIGSPPFGIGQSPDGTPVRVGQLQVCCHCGETRVLYTGPVEEGHGPFVVYPEPASHPASKLVLPNGPLPKLRRS